MQRVRANGSVLACLVLAVAVATSASAATPVDDAMQKRIDGKAKRLLEAAKIADADKAAKVKGVLGDWIVTMDAWHKEHDAEIAGLWKEWNAARSFKPGQLKDEYPGEVVAAKIEAIYASLQPAYQDFLTKLGTEATPEQIDAIKETWSRSPGMMRTYTAYLEIAPDLNDEQKQVIKDRMLLAREAAMLTDSDKEIINLYKRHKLKIEQYVGAIQWQKLHKAYADKGSAKPTT